MAIVENTMNDYRKAKGERSIGRVVHVEGVFQNSLMDSLVLLVDSTQYIV
jgi:hypothetical protein